MEEMTQQEKFFKEERLSVNLIQSLQSEIDAYSEDLAVARGLSASLSDGSNNNAWQSYVVYIEHRNRSKIRITKGYTSTQSKRI